MRSFRQAVVAMIVGLTWSGFAWAETKPTYTLHQPIIVKQGGKPDRVCRVVAVDKQSDGSFIYKMKVEETGQILAIREQTKAPVTELPPLPLIPTTSPTPMKPTSPYASVQTPRPSPTPARPVESQTARATLGMAKMPWENSGLSMFPNKPAAQGSAATRPSAELATRPLTHNPHTALKPTPAIQPVAFKQNNSLSLNAPRVVAATQPTPIVRSQNPALTPERENPSAIPARDIVFPPLELHPRR